MAASVQPNRPSTAPAQTFLPAHCKHLFSSPRLLTEQLKQTCFPQAPHAVFPVAKSSPPSLAPQSSQVQGAGAGDRPRWTCGATGAELMLQNRCRDCCVLGWAATTAR